MENEKKKHNFNLEKGKKHNFNLEKDDDIDNTNEAVTPEPGNGEPSYEDPIPEPKNTKRKVVYIILAICVLSAIGLLLWGNFNTPVKVGTEDTIISDGIDSPATGNSTGAQRDTTIALPTGENPVGGEGSETTETGTAAPAQPAAGSDNNATNAPAAAPEQHKANATEAPAAAEVPSGSIDDQARKTIQGAYGNGAERRNNLGSSYRDVQRRVNEMLR